MSHEQLWNIYTFSWRSYCKLYTLRDLEVNTDIFPFLVIVTISCNNYETTRYDIEIKMLSTTGDILKMAHKAISIKQVH